jgi:hypothetical protein
VQVLEGPGDVLTPVAEGGGVRWDDGPGGGGITAAMSGGVGSPRGVGGW